MAPSTRQMGIWRQNWTSRQRERAVLFCSKILAGIHGEMSAHLQRADPMDPEVQWGPVGSSGVPGPVTVTNVVATRTGSSHLQIGSIL